MMTTLLNLLLAVTLVLLLIGAWRNPRLRTAGVYGRRSEQLLWISIAAALVALLIHP